MTAQAPTRTQAVRAFVPESPFVRHLGIELVSIGGDEARLRLPFRDVLPTMGDVVHGGAIATLIDTAGMAAAWADDTIPESLRGATVNLTVNLAGAARGSDLLAVARVVRRTRTLCFCDVVVTQAADGADAVVAHGTVTHRYG